MAQLIVKSKKVTTRRPDAFEEAARRLWVREQKNPWTLNDARFTMLVAKLLRAQHREVRRMVAVPGFASESQCRAAGESAKKLETMMKSTAFVCVVKGKP
jgi:hypothetical protein